jgi:hypothetical protein
MLRRSSSANRRCSSARSNTDMPPCFGRTCARHSSFRNPQLCHCSTSESNRFSLAGPRQRAALDRLSPWTFRPSALHRDLPASRSPLSASNVRGADAKPESGPPGRSAATAVGLPGCQRASGRPARLCNAEWTKKSSWRLSVGLPQRGRPARRCGAAPASPLLARLPEGPKALLHRSPPFSTIHHLTPGPLVKRKAHDVGLQRADAPRGCPPPADLLTPPTTCLSICDLPRRQKPPTIRPGSSTSRS